MRVDRLWEFKNTSHPWRFRDVKSIHMTIHGNVISILDHAVIDTYVQRTRPGRYTCQINQIIGRVRMIDLTSRQK